MAAKQNASILGEAKPSKAIIKLALPATLALLAKAVYNIVDTAYIGMLKDDIALTAVGVTVPLLLIKVLHDTDRARAVYLKDYTDQIMGQAENYHLCLDSGALGIEHTVKILEAVYRTT